MDNLNSLLKSKHRTPASKALPSIKYFCHLARKDLFSILHPPGKRKPYFQLITRFNTIPQVLNNSLFEKHSIGKKNYNIDLVFLYISLLSIPNYLPQELTVKGIDIDCDEKHVRVTGSTEQ